MMQLKQNYYILLVFINFITHCENIENNVLSNCLALRQAFIHSNGNLAPEDLRAFGACIAQDKRFGYNGGLTREEHDRHCENENGSLAFLGNRVVDNINGDVSLGQAYIINCNAQAALNYIKILPDDIFKEQISEILAQSSFREISNDDYRQLIEHTVNDRHIDLNTIEAYKYSLMKFICKTNQSTAKAKILKQYGADFRSITIDSIKAIQEDIKRLTNTVEDIEKEWQREKESADLAKYLKIKQYFEERLKNNKEFLDFLKEDSNK